MIFWQLFITFLKIGAFTFGGGYAMIALIQSEVVTEHHWMTSQEFTDLVAVSQMTPGPIGINTATYTGYAATLNAGYSTPWAIVGAVLASLAVILIPVVLTLVVCRFLSQHKDHPSVHYILGLLRLVVVGLIASAALCLLTVENFGSPTVNRGQFILSVILFVVAFLLSMLHNKIEKPWLQRLTSPIELLIGGGIVGLLFSM